MDRLTLTPAQQAFIDAYHTEFNPDPNAEVIPGTNVVVDDHLLLDANNAVIVVGGPSPYTPGCFDGFVPLWGELMWVPFTPEFLPYVIDRAGPNGQTMPIYDEEEPEARQAGEPAGDPREAARAERREDRARRRDFREMVRDAIKRMPRERRKHVRGILRAKGILGHDEDERDDDR